MRPATVRPLRTCGRLPIGASSLSASRTDAAWDTVPRGIPCRAGFHAVRDTVQRVLIVRPPTRRALVPKALRHVNGTWRREGLSSSLLPVRSWLWGCLGCACMDSDARMCRCAQPCTIGWVLEGTRRETRRETRKGTRGYSRVLEERLEERLEKVLEGTRGYSRVLEEVLSRTAQVHFGLPPFGPRRLPHTHSNIANARNARARAATASEAGWRAESCRAVRHTVPYRGIPTYRAAWDTYLPCRVGYWRASNS